MQSTQNPQTILSSVIDNNNTTERREYMEIDQNTNENEANTETGSESNDDSDDSSSGSERKIHMPQNNRYSQDSSDDETESDPDKRMSDDTSADDTNDSKKDHSSNDEDNDSTSSDESSSASDRILMRRSKDIMTAAQSEKQLAAKAGVPKSAYGYDWKVIEKVVHAVFRHQHAHLLPRAKGRWPKDENPSPPTKKRKLSSSSHSSKSKRNSKSKSEKVKKVETHKDEKKKSPKKKVKISKSQIMNSPSSNSFDPFTINWYEVQKSLDAVAPFTVAELKAIWRFVAYDMDEYGNGPRKRLNIKPIEHKHIVIDSDNDEDADVSDIDAPLPVTTFIKFPRPQYLPRARLLRPLLMERYTRPQTYKMARKRLLEQNPTGLNELPWDVLETTDNWNEQSDVKLVHSLLLFRKAKCLKALTSTEGGSNSNHNLSHASSSSLSSAPSVPSENPVPLKQITKPSDLKGSAEAMCEMLRLPGIPVTEEEWIEVTEILEGHYKLKRKPQFCHDRFAVLARTVLFLDRNTMSPIEGLEGSTLSEQLRLCMLRLAEVPESEIQSWLHLSSPSYRADAISRLDMNPYRRPKSAK